MAIFAGSRYQNSTVDFIPIYNGGGKAPLVIYTFPDINQLSYREYTWKNGDRLDAIAADEYKDASRWWIIPEYNPEIVDFQNIVPGTVIRIPHV